MKARQVEIFDKEGNLTKIEVTLENDEHLFDALWDARDEQTHDNRVEFRQWVNRQIRAHDHEPC
jgi:hypothetical protein